MKHFLNFLEDYYRDITPVIDKFLQEEREKAISVAPIAGQMIDDFKDFLEGGKKLRGAEILLAYEMFGEKDRQVGLLASLTIEIIHASLLIHDDFMDQDDLRRGKLTMHKKYARGRDQHFGDSMAVNIGDEGFFLASYLLNSLDLPRERLSWAMQFLSHLLMETGLGQALDISYEQEKRFTEEDVLIVHRYKTAEYTIPGPISVGAILAGAKEKDLVAIKDFGIPVGVAFQIHDDELGMFSTKEQLGKPADSDLREGKLTLLIVKAFEKAKGKDLGFLKYAYGNRNLTSEEVDKVREIIKKTGALKYSQSLSYELVEKGKKFVPKVTSDLNYQNLLRELADLAIERKN